MKHFLFIFILACPLWACSSCDGWGFGWGDKEEKITGTKPEILLGKWENKDTFSDGLCWFGCFHTDGYIWTTYEFRLDGLSIIELKYYFETDEYKGPFIDNIKDWLYSEKEETLYLVNSKGGRWTYSLVIASSDSIQIRGQSGYYYRIKE